MDTSASSVFSVSPQELARLMGTLDAPVILDVRRQPAFAASSHTLATAQRCAPEDIPAFAATQPNGEVLVYCAFGHTVSQQAADILRKSGWSARFLAGGILGGEAGVDTPQDMAEWRSTPPPTIRKRPDLGVTGAAPSRWITRQRPKIDRIACPWLIRRFIDRRAEFFYVETAAVFTEGQRLQAVAYDIPGAPISHEGDLCSFDALLTAFDLYRDPALMALAQIVRGADTDHLEAAPQAAGLLALSLGLSALHATDDAAMLEAAMPLYDALYAWCRQQVAGPSEGHSWKPDTMKAAQA